MKEQKTEAYTLMLGKSSVFSYLFISHANPTSSLCPSATS